MDADAITTSEVAALIGESSRQVNRMVHRKEIVPLKKLPGVRGAYLFNRADIEALLTPSTEVAS